MVTKKKSIDDMSENEKNLTPVYARAAMQNPVPKYELPEGELDPETAYNLIHDELMLDGNARLQFGHVRHHLDGATS